MWYVILLFVVIIGGIYIGVFTPTEAGTVGTFFILFVKQRVDFRSIGHALMETMRLLGLIYIIVIGTTIFFLFLSLNTIPMELSDWMMSLELPPIVGMLFTILVFIIFGCFIDSLTLVLLFTLIFFPVVVNMGLYPIWFGVIIMTIMQQAMMTPSIGMRCFIMSANAHDLPWYNALLVCHNCLYRYPARIPTDRAYSYGPDVL